MQEFIVTDTSDATSRLAADIVELETVNVPLPITETEPNFSVVPPYVSTVSPSTMIMASFPAAGSTVHSPFTYVAVPAFTSTICMAAMPPRALFALSAPDTVSVEPCWFAMRIAFLPSDGTLVWVAPQRVSAVELEDEATTAV